MEYLQSQRDLDEYERVCELELSHDILINPTIPCELPPVAEPETVCIRWTRMNNSYSTRKTSRKEPCPPCRHVFSPRDK